eukprot:548606_1
MFIVTCLIWYLIGTVAVADNCESPSCQRNENITITTRQCYEMIDMEPYVSHNNIGIIYCVNQFVLELLNTTQDMNSSELIFKIKEINKIFDELNKIELHHLLYHINIKTDIFHQVHKLEKVLYSYIQQMIFEEEFENNLNNYQNKYLYPIVLDMNDDNNTLLFELFYGIINQHDINSHYFFSQLINGNVSYETFSRLLQSIYPFTRVWHLIVSGIAHSTPLEWRYIIFDNCLDETMVNQSHPTLFQKMWANNIPEYITPMYEVLYSFNAKVYAAYHSKSVTFTLGAFSFFELIVSRIAEKIFFAASNNYNFTNADADLSYVKVHASIDIQHSNGFFSILNYVINSIKTSSLSETQKIEEIYQIIYGGIFLLDAEVGYIDKLL